MHKFLNLHSLSSRRVPVLVSTACCICQDWPSTHVTSERTQHLSSMTVVTTGLFPPCSQHGFNAKYSFEISILHQGVKNMLLVSNEEKTTLLISDKMSLMLSLKRMKYQSISWLQCKMCCILLGFSEKQKTFVSVQFFQPYVFVDKLF